MQVILQLQCLQRDRTVLAAAAAKEARVLLRATLARTFRQENPDVPDPLLPPPRLLLPQGPGRAVRIGYPLPSSHHRPRQRQRAPWAWAVRTRFTLADCAAVPALFYATIVEPLPKQHTRVAEYFERLMSRPSVGRILDEARPYFQMFPFKDAMPARFL